MDPTHIELFSLAERRMSWIDRRQEVLAADVANVDTPGYRSRDAAPFATVLDAFRIDATLTSPAHIPVIPDDTESAIAVADLRAPDGNAVSLDSVLARMADTDASQELTSSIYKTYMSLFRTALGR